MPHIAGILSVLCVGRTNSNSLKLKQKGKKYNLLFQITEGEGYTFCFFNHKLLNSGV